MSGAPPTTKRVRGLILTIGDELLAGDIVDRNSAHMGRWCRIQGIEVVRSMSVRDREEEIVSALEWGAAHVDVVLTSGGLGPTTDDLTAAAVARAAGVGLERHDEIVERLARIFEKWGRELVKANKKQADLPVGCEVLENPIGTAPGFAVRIPASPAGPAGPAGPDGPDGPDRPACWVASMPGVPREMHRMLDEQVGPRVRERFALDPNPRRIYRTLGRGESAVQHQLRDFLAELPRRGPGFEHVMVHYRASMPEVLLNFEALPGPDGTRCGADDLRMLDAPLAEALGNDLYGIGEANLPTRLVALLIEAGLTLSSAESCTGGMVGELLTEIPGASACYLGGIIAYDNRVKRGLLDVPLDMLAAHGAVSEPVARAMAEGARERTGSDLSLAITGIAGPDGGTPEKPVGTVHIAVSGVEGTTHRHVRFPGNRGTVRRGAAYGSLRLVWDRLVDRGLARVMELD